MSNKNGSKALTVVDFGPTVEVPEKAPPLQVDVTNPLLSLDDVLPDNFISMEGLEAWLKERGAESRILTVIGVSMELLYDPQKGEKPADGEWKPCLSFAETASKLVINKTRGAQLTALARSRLLAAWAQVGQIAIRPGIANGKAQVVIDPVPDEGVDIDAINADLFG